MFELSRVFFFIHQKLNEHDLEQDDRYSPHTLRQTLDEKVSDDDDTSMDETQEDNGSQFPLELTYDDEFLRASQSSLACTRKKIMKFFIPCK